MEHTKLKTTEFKTAPISAFKSLRAPILCGQNLNDVKNIERSILEFGLMSPIVVSVAKHRLVIIDGKKRLAAIKRLAFDGTLPRSLVNIPYILTEDAKEMDFRAASVLSGRDLYQAVMSLKQSGTNVEDIAKRLYLDRRSIIETISLSRLSDQLRQAFFDKTISFDQALAFTALPDLAKQEALLLKLGPFAKPRVILETIRDLKNQAQIKIEASQVKDGPDNNVFILPVQENNCLENGYTDYAHITPQAA